MHMKTTTGFCMTTGNKQGQITQAMFVEFLGKVVIQLYVTGIALHCGICTVL